MKNGKRAVSFILAVVLLCTSLAGCGMVQQDKAYLEQVAAAVTETQSILKDVEAAADELSGQSSIVYENSVNAEGFDVLDEYYTLCTEKLNALNDAVGAVRQQMQSLERCDAPKTEKGKAVEAEQKAYFEDALEVIGGIQEALTFYTAQYDALQPLVTATVGDRSDEQAYLFSGGYHAPTYSRCFILTNAIFVFVYLLSEVIRWYKPLLIPFAILSCISIFLLSPIRITKHPLSERLYAQNKKTARILVSIDFLLFLILYITGMPTRYLATWALSLSAVAIMMVITLFEKNSTRRESV